MASNMAMTLTAARPASSHSTGRRRALVLFATVLVVILTACSQPSSTPPSTAETTAGTASDSTVVPSAEVNELGDAARPTPPEDGAPAVDAGPVQGRIWMSHTSVSAGGQGILFAVVSPDERINYGVAGSLERWDGQGWVEQFVFATQPPTGGWPGRVEFPSEEFMVEAIGYAAGPEHPIGVVEALNLPRLEPGTWRLVKSTAPDPASAVFDVIDGAAVDPVLDTTPTPLVAFPDALSTRPATTIDDDPCPACAEVPGAAEAIRPGFQVIREPGGDVSDTIEVRVGPVDGDLTPVEFEVSPGGSQIEWDRNGTIDRSMPQLLVVQLVSNDGARNVYLPIIDLDAP